ncbi:MULTISPECIES: glycosyltransferase family 2 protein [unclassified Campylobacter]|uniref:glycosyltransferase family 2 protein n=1 Tax=unclassified Campylobacter TaxID=2593542 RepID=UPI0022E9A133|nr:MULTISPECIES: glycosyltransferase family 2 protein [unclassified Campylobacter]MDA3061755.1 glycosyltransferase family 2 protein [Campylobacter sp. JMF_14 EL1]MDA3073139.1 glycosyltransferase family 2 protein [Campylobacter sp. JMF_10 EL2]
MINASVYAIVQNEEKHIERMLKSVADFAEIIIVDSGSTDKTLEIAQKFNAKIYHKKFTNYAEQKEFAKNLCSNEWVLNLDGDEEISVELKDEISKVIENNDIDGLEIKISTLYLGKWTHKFGKHIQRIRFFRKSCGHYPEKLIHESIKFTGKSVVANGIIRDYGTQNLQIHIDKINKYSTLRAEEKIAKNKKSSCLKLIFVFPAIFIKSYFIRKNFLNGKSGFIGSMINAFYAFMKEAKLYEIWLNKKGN